LGRRTYLDALVALAALANIGAGAWMWWVFRWQSDPMGAGSSQRYTSILFTSALLLILLQRFRLASVRARENIDLLDRQVALKEQELAQVYRIQEQWAREQATQQERQRIWRDLHDGLGAHLNTALRQLQSERVDPNSLRDTLQDGLFQLKLSVDAANLPLGDLGVLLGSLRYRLAPRLQAAGLTLHWEVDALPRLPQLESPQALRELQFIVYEALANVLQHSRARSLLVRARREAGGVVLLIRDDGPLESGVSSSGRGLRSMHERALALGIELAISHEESGTQVRLFIALH
jgi:signal transduction histidine kinase